MKLDALLEAAYALLLVWAVAALLLLIVMTVSATCDLVGERAPSPSPVVTATARADSEAAPARSLADGNGEDGVGELADPPSSGVIPDDGASVRAGSSPAPASTVTQSALKEEGGAGITRDPFPVTMPSRPTVTVSPTDGGAYIAPATPVATSRAVETLAPVSYTFAPWPVYLWPTVECLIARESGGDPNAVGLAGERGLMQVHPITWPYLAQYGITPDALFDPATNIRAAYLLYLEAGGLRPWGGGCA